jgi:hypothetical protein
MIDALRNGGDLLNVFGDFPTLADPRHADAYSPLWDAQLGLWTSKAVSAGLNTRQIDENVQQPGRDRFFYGPETLGVLTAALASTPGASAARNPSELGACGPPSSAICMARIRLATTGPSVLCDDRPPGNRHAHIIGSSA